MTTRSAQFVLALVRKYNRRWGRPLSMGVLHRLVYFAQAEGAPINLSFHLHKYGPYSPELEDILADLKFFRKVEVRLGPGGEAEVVPAPASR